MARVPTTGNFDMISSANSIHQVLVTEFGYSGALDFNSMIAWCKANLTISYFHPSFRPALLTSLNQTLHFRGFPMPVSNTGDEIVWHMKENLYLLA